MSVWSPDVLGSSYEQRVLPLGADPDGEGDVVATLVRHTRTGTRGAYLHVHGYTDYFFQTGLAEHLVAQGYTFYALDLRKCGRSIREGHTPHFVSDLAYYDTELNEALRIIRGEHGDAEILLGAHSTGGLIVPLWLDRLRRQGRAAVDGLILNSPWFDLQGPSCYRGVGTILIDAIGRIAPMRIIPLDSADAYGTSLHIGSGGEWEYNLTWKPLRGFPARFGWLRAVRRGHAQLHRGLDVGCRSLVLRSTRSHFVTAHDTTGPNGEVGAADGVLDVRHIARWAGCLGNRTVVVPIEGARHDVFLSQEEARTTAYAELDAWLSGTAMDR